MKTVAVFIFLVLFIMLTAYGQQEEKYSRIKIFIPDRSSLNHVWSSGIDFEGSIGKIGGWMEFVAGAAELKNLSSMSVSYQVVVDDLTAEYKKQLNRAPANALGFGYGSMGGFYTFAEVVQQLDSMRLLYPTLITAKQSLGTSVEGRQMWAVMNPIIPMPPRRMNRRYYTQRFTTRESRKE